ncbi:MAG: hypothetical protein IPK04_06825 [Bdellovibrionales bacterium]|nr:hypothetical protein [Bdellovibrionales bacterium]
MNLFLNLLTSCTILVCLTTGVAYGHGCFRQHLKEGLALNQERQRLYSNLTQGATKEVSAELIYLEKMAILGSYSISNLDAQGATLCPTSLKRSALTTTC